MKISTFFYNLQQGFKNIWRNKMFSLASIATMTLTIFLFGIFYSILVNVQTMVSTAEEGISVTVFFDEGASQKTIDNIGKEIENYDGVSKYNYISADEAWETFKKDYFDGKEDVADSFDGDNPLADSANYEVFFDNVEDQTAFADYMLGVKGVREVNQSEAATKVLSDFNKLLAAVSIVMIIVLLAVASFLINNTITMGIAVRKEEIAIMKLIGAKDAFVRQPFIVEGVTIGLVGAVIPSVLMYFLYQTIMTYIANKFSFLSSMITFVPVSQVFSVLVPVSLILGVGIGYVGSRLTLKKHLKV